MRYVFALKRRRDTMVAHAENATIGNGAVRCGSPPAPPLAVCDELPAGYTFCRKCEEFS